MIFIGMKFDIEFFGSGVSLWGEGIVIMLWVLIEEFVICEGG